ncbi:anti-lipopolysaccharide factor-like [Penaeus japonicus]|uniref:anti-lipopolysaccharide factor-like n=1 Tax=Penaeus japonicus TaxID=27405 RepID=UPI001C70B184|nr:anti-lipopolysaccharide factor-like [Penaeus japonicus]
MWNIPQDSVYESICGRMTAQRTSWVPWLTLALLTATSVMHLSAAQEVESRDEILPEILGKFFDVLVRDGEIELLGHYCSYGTRPHLIRWRLKFKSKLWCPGWTLLYGTSSDDSSASNSLQNAIVNFVNKAVQAGLVSAEDAMPWLQ